MALRSLLAGLVRALRRLIAPRGSEARDVARFQRDAAQRDVERNTTLPPPTH